ncbi:TetR/AcrR family transcriptional regulator [Pseudoduganella umbonata]|nr:TetR/AcrR family transcriptional regulator [Pseudoduganella umbonata]
MKEMTHKTMDPPDRPSRPRTGRPRTFDEDDALDRAMEVFWEKGYEGSSLPELTAAMGMNRPSLYAVFGNKEALFRRAVERYQSTRLDFCDAALEAATSREVVERLLRGSADVQTCPDSPHGCLGTSGALACGDEARPLRDELVALRSAREQRLRQRLERAVAEGDLPAHADAAQLASFVATIVQGMAVQAAGGATRDELYRTIDFVMAAWPGKQENR